MPAIQLLRCTRRPRSRRSGGLDPAWPLRPGRPSTSLGMPSPQRSSLRVRSHRPGRLAPADRGFAVRTGGPSGRADPFDKSARHIAGPPRPVDDVAVWFLPSLNLRRLPQSLRSPPGGDEGIRTPDLCFAKAALSQLSYIPVRVVSCQSSVFSSDHSTGSSSSGRCLCQLITED